MKKHVYRWQNTVQVQKPFQIRTRAFSVFRFLQKIINRKPGIHNSITWANTTTSKKYPAAAIK